MKVFFVADQHVEAAGNSPDHLLATLGATDRRPELRSIIQVERRDCARRLRRLHAFDDHVGSRFRERGEDASRMEPAHAASEDLRPVEIARLEQCGGFVGPVVEDDRSANAMPPIAVNGRDIRAADAVVLEPFVERGDARLADAALHQLADRVVDHGGCDAGLEPEAIREVRGDVVLPPRDMDLDRARLPERDHSGVESVDKRPEGEKVELAGIRAHIETAHGHSPKPFFRDVDPGRNDESYNRGTARAKPARPSLPMRERQEESVHRWTQMNTD